MKIILETTGELDDGQKITIETERDHYDIHEMWDVVIKPALIAFGYGAKTVNELVDEIR